MLSSAWAQDESGDGSGDEAESEGGEEGDASGDGEAAEEGVEEEGGEEGGEGGEEGGEDGEDTESDERAEVLMSVAWAEPRMSIRWSDGDDRMQEELELHKDRGILVSFRTEHHHNVPLHAVFLQTSLTM